MNYNGILGSVESFFHHFTTHDIFTVRIFVGKCYIVDTSVVSLFVFFFLRSVHLRYIGEIFFPEIQTYREKACEHDPLKKKKKSSSKTILKNMALSISRILVIEHYFHIGEANKLNLFSCH